jgi:hypothetical protein
MFHISNLIHIALFVAYWYVLDRVARNTEPRVVRGVSRLIQLSLACLCVDALLGFFVIDYFYGPTPSAIWMTRSVVVVPILLVVSLWRMRKWRRQD